MRVTMPIFTVLVYVLCLISKGEGVVTVSSGRTKYYKFVVQVAYLAPDNFLNEGLTINGQFPGPTIRVKQGDTLVVDVENQIPRPFAMHWHGMLQIGTFQSDGVPNVTQAAIPTGGCYRYKFNVGAQVGTFWYHGHIGYEQMWALGSLIIEDNSLIYSRYPKDYFYHEERTLLLASTFHITVPQFSDLFVGDNAKGQIPPDGLLINGKSVGSWANFTADGKGLELYRVKPMKIYRFRIISTALQNPILCTFENHTLSVIEMDGIYTVPVTTDRVLIYPAQRYSVRVKMDQPIGNYKIQCQYYPNRFDDSDGGAAVLSYEGSADPMPLLLLKPPTGGFDSDAAWIFDKLRPNVALNQLSVYPVPTKVDREIRVTFAHLGTTGKQTVLVNGVSYAQPPIPYDVQVNRGVTITDEPRVFPLKVGQAVQIVYTFLVRQSLICTVHPMHIHGHSFWVVGSGLDAYEPKRDDPTIEANIASGNMQFRDVFVSRSGQRVANLTAGAPCGWTAVRFIADNPGIWLNHCHIPHHMEEGLIFAMWEFTEEDQRLSTVSRKQNHPPNRCYASY